MGAMDFFYSTNDSLLWYDAMAAELLEHTPLHTGTVHAMDTSQEPRMATREILNARITIPVPVSQDLWASCVKPNLPWAENHFQERVSGDPMNPPPSAADWPFAQAGHEEHLRSNGGKFSHTYPERFWPRHAGAGMANIFRPMTGIRFEYGDLSDVVDVLVKNPASRQAYLAVWFPEDAYAATLGERVPCTIGYHFMIRKDLLYCWYTMRAADYVRYLRDDIYMAGRLMQWVVSELESRGAGLFYPGKLYLTISSLHSFVGDDWLLKRLKRRYERATQS
jgi:hypothetical protein